MIAFNTSRWATGSLAATSLHPWAYVDNKLVSDIQQLMLNSNARQS